MPKTYDEVMTVRRSRQGTADAARRAILEQAYGIAMQIIELRERRGLTQTQLAERCGVDQGDISRIERGAKNPTAGTLQRIAAALDADIRLVARAG